MKFYIHDYWFDKNTKEYVIEWRDETYDEFVIMCVPISNLIDEWEGLQLIHKKGDY